MTRLFDRGDEPASPVPAPGADDRSDAPAPTRRNWAGLAVLSLSLAMIVLDGTIVGVALPTIIHDIDLDLTDAQWVNSLYAVILAALLLSTGSLADRTGRRRMVILGIVVFVAGSLLAAAADSAAPLLVRSEEHPSELQSRFDYVCRLMLD